MASPVNAPLLLEGMVVITSCFFHDVWNKIMVALKKQTEFEFSFKPIHVDKAIINLSPENAKLLCSNKCPQGWSTVGNFYVRFEEWSSELHATHSLISCYGGWLHFRGVPIHLWN